MLHYGRPNASSSSFVRDTRRKYLGGWEVVLIAAGRVWSEAATFAVKVQSLVHVNVDTLFLRRQGISCGVQVLERRFHQ